MQFWRENLLPCAYSKMLLSDWTDKQTNIFCLQDPFFQKRELVEFWFGLEETSPSHSDTHICVYFSSWRLDRSLLLTMEHTCPSQWWTPWTVHGGNDRLPRVYLSCPTRTVEISFPRSIPNCVMKSKFYPRRTFVADQIDTDCPNKTSLFYQLPFQKVSWHP